MAFHCQKPEVRKHIKANIFINGIPINELRNEVLMSLYDSNPLLKKEIDRKIKGKTLAAGCYACKIR